MTRHLELHGSEHETPRGQGSVLAGASVIAGMTLSAMGNGLMFAFIPVRLAAEGFAPTWAGAALASLSVGGMAGCLLTGGLVRRLGHARAFMAFAAMIVVSNVTIGSAVHPVLWLLARALYGCAISGLFIVSQSWLNDAVGNAIRGRVMAIFYVCYVVGLGAGSFILRFLDVLTFAAPAVAVLFAVLSMVPVGMSRLAPPVSQPAARLDFRGAWRLSPAAVAGMMASGGLSMMVSGFAPIHATATGYTQAQVATLLFAMPIGTLIFQIPLGWISDRTDRRYVLIAAALLSAAAGVTAFLLDGSPLLVTIAIYIVWSGSGESIYSLANAHSADRAEKRNLVALSSTLLFAWSFAGFVVPAVATGLTAYYGTRSFMVAAIFTAIAFSGFVGWRVRTDSTR